MLVGCDLNTADQAKLRQLSRGNWAAGRYEAAIQDAWAALRLGPQDLASKVLLTSLLHRYPRSIEPDKRSDLIQLLQDREIDPDDVSLAGWVLILRDASWESASENEEFETLAARLDDDELCQALLREAPVHVRAAERRLIKVRRWLLLSGQWRRYRRLLDALAIQATLNGGAWPFDETERALLDESPGLPIVAAYLPVRDSAPSSCAGDVVEEPVARTVAADYERWPYPAWQRVTARHRRRLPDDIRALDPDGPDCIPVDGKILVAGCGTGKEAAVFALTYPDSAITAIDVSKSSLRYARRQCTALGIPGIRFLNLDLHNVSELNEQFDVITCTGVLHHLPDPELGWAALRAVLRPGGVMAIKVYSRIGYPNIAAEPTLISDLTCGPVNDDMLRRVRQRLMDRSDSTIARSIINTTDFGTLAGTRDLVLHTQVQLFDVPRISRALDNLGLRLLSFSLPRPDARTRYDKMFPHDPMHRDVESWAKFEENEPNIFRSMYEFVCRAPTAG